ncbi:MAG: hypothetical protein HYX26_04315 [Acidobacteriales bacterium]|nr:hypothetical protein [Terriglobales bacterium]
MPTKRRFILFLIVLAVMLLLKRALSQDEATVAWDPATTDFSDSITNDALAAAILGAVFGIVAGGFRVASRQFAALKDRYFTGDLVTLKISTH